MKRPIVCIMTKVPQIGAVKTRLSRDIGPVAAWRFYVGTLRTLSRSVGRAPFWSARLLVTPDRGRYGWPMTLAKVKQGHGDLGDRMIAGLTSAPRGVPVIVIGCDIPGISVDILRDALRRLRRADVVFGPATDGGYWLIGFSGRRGFWRPFADVAWSTAHTLQDNQRNFRGRKIEFTAPLRDVDDVSAWLLARGVP